MLSKPPPEQPVTNQPPPSAQSSEFPIRKKKLGGGARIGKKGLSRLLGRIGGEKEEEGGLRGMFCIREDVLNIALT